MDEQTPQVTEVTPEQKPHVIVRSYRATREFFLGRKSPHENILQYIIRQFLFPDSRGKPSLTATFFVWIVVLISYVTNYACRLAFNMNETILPNGTIIRQMVGFSDSLIYLYITIVGLLGYMFQNREKREVGMPIIPTPQGILGTVIDKAKGIIGMGSGQPAPAPQPQTQQPAPQVLPPGTP